MYTNIFCSTPIFFEFSHIASLNHLFNYMIDFSSVSFSASFALSSSSPRENPCIKKRFSAPQPVLHSSHTFNSSFVTRIFFRATSARFLRLVFHFSSSAAINLPLGFTSSACTILGFHFLASIFRTLHHFRYHPQDSEIFSERWALRWPTIFRYFQFSGDYAASLRCVPHSR